MTRRRNCPPALVIAWIALTALAWTGCSDDDPPDAPIWNAGKSLDLAIELPPAELTPGAVSPVYTQYSILESGTIWFRNSTGSTLDVAILVTVPSEDWVLIEVGRLEDLSPGRAEPMTLEEAILDGAEMSSDWAVGVSGSEGAGLYPIQFGRPGRY